MKKFLGIAVALVIFRIAESVYDYRGHAHDDLDAHNAHNLIDVDGYELGTECPPGHTGPLPYAMDCRQFLNCWKGHGTIQSCAPGTMFNPRSLECDHPSKVKCKHFDEFREMPVLIHSPPVLSIECMAGATGLFPHPVDCAKFLNCNNGATVIQDCGPGTWFNARLQVCDWPHKTDCLRKPGTDEGVRPQPVINEPHPPFYGEGVIQARMYPSATRPSNNNPNTNSNLKYSSPAASAPHGNGNANGAHSRVTQQPAGWTVKQQFGSPTPIPATTSVNYGWKTYDQLEALEILEGHADTVDAAVRNPNEKRIRCKDDWVGLYPHPFNCRKFLNCNNGATFIQDCGPGTAFNPSIQVCDWPHNVNCADREYDVADADATNKNVLVNKPHDSEPVPAETHIQPDTYPLLSQHVDEDFRKHFYDESQTRQTGQITSNGIHGNAHNLNSQSTHDLKPPSTQFNGNDLTNVNEYQNTHIQTHDVNYDNSYQPNYGQKPLPHRSEGSSTSENSFTIENQYGIRENGGSNVAASETDRNINYEGHGGQNTLVNTQFRPSNAHVPYGGGKPQYAGPGHYGEQDTRHHTQFNRVDETSEANTTYIGWRTTEKSPVSGPTGDIFGNGPSNPQLNTLDYDGHTEVSQQTLTDKALPGQFGAHTTFGQTNKPKIPSTTLNTPTTQSHIESTQTKYNAQREYDLLNEKVNEVETNLIAPGQGQTDRVGKSKPKSQYPDGFPFASESGFIGDCSSVPGLLPHPFDCSKFVNCESGKAFEQDCAPGTLFNPVLKICDFAHKVKCPPNKPVVTLYNNAQAPKAVESVSQTPQQFDIRMDLQPPKIDKNEPHTISMSSGYAKTTKNAPPPTKTVPSYQPPSTHFPIPDMSVLPLSSDNSATKYHPIESEEDERKEPTTPSPVTKPKPVYYPSYGRPSLGTDTEPEEIESVVQQIQRPSDQVVYHRDSKSVVVHEPESRPPIPKEKEHIMPIYQRRRTTSTPPTLSIENQYSDRQPNYNRVKSDAEYESKPIDTKTQTDFLPLSEALKLLLRPYVNDDMMNKTDTQMVEKKLLEMADKNKDTKTDHTATLEQSSLAHALFNEQQPPLDGVKRDENFDYYAHLNYDRTQKHDQNCQHYHPPSTFYHLPPNFKHSPEFHEYMNRKHALSGKEFYIEENTPSNVELLPGATLHQHGYHHPPLSSAPIHHRTPHHMPHHPSHHNHHHHPHHPYHNSEHEWASESTAPTTNSLDAPSLDDSLPHTTPHQHSYGISSRAYVQNGQCENQFNCQNGLCVPFTKVCDGHNDCGNRYDESSCRHVGYEVRLSNERGQRHMGRIEVKAFGRWGYVCDDNFSLVDANVACRELGFKLGAAEVKSNSYYGPNANMSVESMFMMDEVNCSGQESSLRDCDFNGWGVSDCNAEEVVGVVCKMPAMKCPSNYFLCEASEQCIPINFMCDGLNDCSDGADESRRYCNAPIEYRLADGNEFEGRVEVKYHGIWGTVCDDDFGESEAAVVCKSLGFDGPAEILNERVGYANGPIWLDQVSCLGNETCLDKCMHFEWGQSNCNHTEDISVRCSRGGALRSEKLLLTQGDNTLSEYDAETQRYIRENQRSSKSMPDYSNVCGQVKVGDNDAETSAERLGQFRVISGTRTKRGHNPWQATIRARGRNGMSSHWCGAVVLSRNHILTAAHCLIGFSKGAYFIRLGDHHSEVYEDSEVEIFIEDWFIHEDFRRGQHMNNDIALILLKQPIQFTNYIQPVCLPSSDSAYTPGRNCTISGWGSIQYGKSTPSLDLKAATVPIISQDVCRQKHIYGDAIMDTMFCAGYLDQSGIDACDGDSGGPLVCADESGVRSLYGIISWGQRCGDSTKPGVYVKVAKYLDWIKSKMNVNRSAVSRT